jgi:hypothetical protein
VIAEPFFKPMLQAEITYQPLHRTIFYRNYERKSGALF